MATVIDHDHAHWTNGFRFTSSLADDVWHADRGPGAYEWWYFDATSDDGRETLVIIFFADFIFSPCFNRAAARDGQGLNQDARPAQFPALACCLYRDGRPFVRAINEYKEADFTASRTAPECAIGASRFHFVRDGGDRTFQLEIDEPLRGGRRLKGSFAWEVIEGDFDGAKRLSAAATQPAHEWNLVAPRCHVRGTYAVSRGKKVIESREFRGVGYHDHNYDARWLPAIVRQWQWGRAHFADTTAVFYHYQELGAHAPVTYVFLTRGGALSALPARVVAQGGRRHIFGLLYSRSLTFEFEHEGRAAALSVRQRKVVDGSYFYLRFIADAALDLGDGRKRAATAVTEHLAPRALRWRGLDWLTDMRIGRGGRGSFLP